MEIWIYTREGIGLEMENMQINKKYIFLIYKLF